MPQVSSASVFDLKGPGVKMPFLPTTALLRFHDVADFSQLCFSTHHRDAGPAGWATSAAGAVVGPVGVQDPLG